MILDLWAIGSIIYLCVVVVSNIKVLTSTKSHTFYSFFLIFISIASYYVILYWTSEYTMFETFDNFNSVVGNYKSQFVALNICITCILIDIIISKIPSILGWTEKPYDPIKDKKLYEQMQEEEYFDVRSRSYHIEEKSDDGKDKCQKIILGFKKKPKKESVDFNDDEDSQSLLEEKEKDIKNNQCKSLILNYFF